MIAGSGSGGDEETFVSIGIPLKAGDHDILCPVSKACSSYEELQIEVQAIKNELDTLLQKAKESFEGPVTEDALGLRPDMSAEEVWSVLSDLSDEDLFIKSYNGLEEDKRRAVAEYVTALSKGLSLNAQPVQSPSRQESTFRE